MDIFIIISLVLSCVVVILLFINNKHLRTLERKKIYDQMIIVMEAERLMIEEGRILLSTEKKILSAEIAVLKAKIDQHEAESTKLADDAETIAHKYIKCRIELIKFLRPDLGDSPDKLQEMRNLLDKRIAGEITLFQFVDQIEIFMDRLSRNEE